MEHALHIYLTLHVLFSRQPTLNLQQPVGILGWICKLDRLPLTLSCSKRHAVLVVRRCLGLLLDSAVAIVLEERFGLTHA